MYTPQRQLWEKPRRYCYFLRFGGSTSKPGGTGVVTLDLGAWRHDFASAVVVRRDGTIVAAGDSVRDDRSEFALVRLTGAGSGGTRYASIGATKLAAGVRLNWQTAAEDGTRAFSIYRTDGNPPLVRRTLLTRTPIRARGRPARYEFLDRDPPSDAPLYWLQEIRREGNRTWFGPITPPRIP